MATPGGARVNDRERKAAIAAYKQREAAAGIYAVRCTATGQVWVGSSPTVDRVKNRLWFTLGLGSNPHRELQAAWSAHGAESFCFEELERRKDGASVLRRDDWLKEHAAVWRERLNALVI
jgi:hypothetical protein